MTFDVVILAKPDYLEGLAVIFVMSVGRNKPADFTWLLLNFAGLYGMLKRLSCGYSGFMLRRRLPDFILQASPSNYLRPLVVRF